MCNLGNGDMENHPSMQPKLGTDYNRSWVLATVLGYQLELETRPVQHFPPPALHLCPQEYSLVQKEIGKPLQKGAITPVKSVHGQFVSQIFVVPKKDGSFGQW